MLGVAIQRLSRDDGLAANALRVARSSSSPNSNFLSRLRDELGWPRLTEQRVNEWVGGKRRLPAAVLIAAAMEADITVDELLELIRSPEGRVLLQEDRYRPQAGDALGPSDGPAIPRLPTDRLGCRGCSPRQRRRPRPTVGVAPPVIRLAVRS